MLRRLPAHQRPGQPYEGKSALHHIKAQINCPAQTAGFVGPLSGLLSGSSPYQILWPPVEWPVWTDCLLQVKPFQIECFTARASSNEWLMRESMATEGKKGNALCGDIGEGETPEDKDRGAERKRGLQHIPCLVMYKLSTAPQGME